MSTSSSTFRRPPRSAKFVGHEIILVFRPASCLPWWKRFWPRLFGDQFANVDILWSEWVETKHHGYTHKIENLRRICVADGKAAQLIEENSGYMSTLPVGTHCVAVDAFLPSTISRLEKLVNSRVPISVSTPTHRPNLRASDTLLAARALFDHSSILPPTDLEKQRPEIADPHADAPIYWGHVIIDALQRSSPSRKYVRDLDPARTSFDELHAAVTRSMA